MVRLWSVRTSLSTRLLIGQEMNCFWGSRRITSIEGSARRTYLAAVAPPQPPPMTTTRLPLFGAKSPRIEGAQPATPLRAIAPSAAPDAVRNRLRVTVSIRLGLLAGGTLAQSVSRTAPDSTAGHRSADQ